MKAIAGEYINLRLLCESDAEITLSWRNSDRASLLNKGAQFIEQQVQWILTRPQSELNYIIETKDKKPIGMVSLIAIDKTNRRAESARFLIGDRAAAKGIPAAVEAMKLLYELAFYELKLLRVHGLVVQSNQQMLIWQKYLGMKQEGILRNHFVFNGVVQDAICVGILAEEFEEVALPKMKLLIKM